MSLVDFDAQNKIILAPGGSGCVILVLDGYCTSHILQTMVRAVFNQSKLLNKMHAVAFVGNHVAMYDRLFATVMAMAEEELQFIKVSALPCGSDVDHRSRLLNLTLRRPLRTRARSNSESNAVRQVEIESEAELVAEMFTCDWRVPTLQHACHIDPITGQRHCSSRADAVAKCQHALHMSIFRGLGNCLPSPIKFWTYEPTQVVQGLGHVLHGILPRAFSRAFPRHEFEEHDDDEENPRLVITAKVKAALDHMADPDSCVNIVSSLLVTEPGECLSQTLQHMDGDFEEHSAQELVRKDGVLHKAQLDMYALLGNDDSPGSLNLSLVAHHFEGAKMESAIDGVRAAALSISAQIWGRLELVYHQFPWLLIRHGDAKVNALEKAALAAAFFAMKKCCLDAMFGLWLRRALKTPADLLRLAPLFAAFAAQANSGNMQLENLLALIKHAAPTIGKAPAVERALRAGCVVQHRKAYEEHGAA